MRADGLFSLFFKILFKADITVIVVPELQKRLSFLLENLCSLKQRLILHLWPKLTASSLGKYSFRYFPCLFRCCGTVCLIIMLCWI